MAELVFERIDVALEATRGTPVTPPTHHLYMEGTLDPQDDWYDDETQVGTLSNLQRSEMLHTSTKLSASGPMDVDTLPVLCNMAIAPVTAPTTPSGATTARLWTFTRVMTADTIKSGTAYWGDPNAKMYQAAFGMLTDLKLSADASGTDAAMQSFDMIAQGITPLGSVPTLPTNGLGPLMVGARMQLWIDTGADAIGTTEITGRVVSAEVDIPNGAAPKYVAVGPSDPITYARVGRSATTPEMTIQIDKVDEDQFNNYQNLDDVKVRLRFNGPLIETVTLVDFYNYVQVDMYGKFRFDSWDDLEGNRTVSLLLRGEYNATPATDVKVYIQNNNTTL